jgi:hypothetical protein
MAEGVDIALIDLEFNRAIDELADTSMRSDIDVLTGQARRAVRAFVKRTRLATERRGEAVRFTRKGRARAGWWHAWAGLGMFGWPFGTDARVLSNAEGDFIDNRRRPSRPEVTIINEVGYISKLDSHDGILLGAMRDRFADMQREIRRRYIKTLRRFSGKL